MLAVNRAVSFQNRTNEEFGLETREITHKSLSHIHPVAVATDRGFLLTFLNESYEFAHPFPWDCPELNKGTRLWKLNLHYMEFVRGLRTSEFIQVVDDWIDANRPFRPGYWLDSWNSYAISIRVVVWIEEYISRRADLPEWFRSKMKASLFEQLTFLERNIEKDIKGNHIIKNIKALWYGSCFFVHDKASIWRCIASVLLEKELRNQILADGYHFERSPSYHSQVFADLADVFALMDDSARRQLLRDTLLKMWQAVIDLTHPDGFTSLFNDSGFHMAPTLSESISIGSRLKADAEAKSHIFYPEAGYFGYRHGSSLFLFDCGPIGPDSLMAHSHGDALAFEWSVGGERVFVDAGVFEYNPGFWRNYCRSTAAHNTVTLNDIDQCEFWSSFRVGRRARVTLEDYRPRDKGFFVRGFHDGYTHLAGKPIHRREIDFYEDRVVIKDEVVGGEGQAVRGRFLLHHDCRIDVCGGVIVIERKGQRIVCRTDKPVSLRPVWWSSDFGITKNTAQLVLNYGKAPTGAEIVFEVENK